MVKMALSLFLIFMGIWLFGRVNEMEEIIKAESDYFRKCRAEQSFWYREHRDMSWYLFINPQYKYQGELTSFVESLSLSGNRVKVGMVPYEYDKGPLTGGTLFLYCDNYSMMVRDNPFKFKCLTEARTQLVCPIATQISFLDEIKIQDVY